VNIPRYLTFVSQSLVPYFDLLNLVEKNSSPEVSEHHNCITIVLTLPTFHHFYHSECLFKTSTNEREKWVNFRGSYLTAFNLLDEMLFSKY